MNSAKMFRKILQRTIVDRHKYINLAAVASKYKYSKNGDEGPQYKYTVPLITAVLGSVIVGVNYGANIDENKQNIKDIHEIKKEDGKVKEKALFEAGAKIPDIPTYTAEEVSKHDTISSFWVIYKHGVYDVTKFLTSHPGGEQILNAGGLSIEPFWNVYGMHKTEEVYKLLESFRIGNLHDDDVTELVEDDLWAREPARSRELIVRTAKPFNAEIPARRQVEHFDTPNELFYVRQHMPVPEMDAATHRVSVTVRPRGGGGGGAGGGGCGAGGGGGAGAVRQFSLAELAAQFPQRTVRAALMCAGNRRSEMNAVKPVKGIGWTGGAVSCARWRGVALRDVLLLCGVDDEADMDGMHVILQGADIDATGTNFSTSIPLHQAMDPAACVLLATHMNDRPLPRDHGAPLRALVPGAPAVRSVKWLESITVSEDESPSHWHQKDYRAFNPSETWESAHFPSAPPLYSLPVTSAVCAPQPGDAVDARDGRVTVRGYAYSGGGASILRVDVSADGGASWTQARAEHADPAPPRRHYAWTLWTADVPVPPGATEVELWAKATDSNFNTQPERFDDIWNIRGILSNAYHRVRVTVNHVH